MKLNSATFLIKLSNICRSERTDRVSISFCALSTEALMGCEPSKSHEFNYCFCASPSMAAAVGEAQCWAARRLAEGDPHGQIVRWLANKQTVED